MIKQVSLLMRFVVIGLIYFILFWIIKIMYMDLKGFNKKKTRISYALEVMDSPDSINVPKGSVFPMHSVTNIGRREDNHVILDDPFVSSYHARITLEKDYFVLRDLGSTNGTILNGQRLEEAEEIVLGDTIEIGRIIFKVIG